jgi:hypothetical protein
MENIMKIITILCLLMVLGCGKYKAGSSTAVPPTAGKDGAPGTPGKDGEPGIPGKDGTDGKSSKCSVTQVGATISITCNDGSKVDFNTIPEKDRYRMVELCGDVAGQGPVFELVLISEDRSFISAYYDDGKLKGLSSFFAAPTAEGYYMTTGSTTTCYFKTYSVNNKVNVCWNNKKSMATSAEIDTACKGTITENCTCEYGVTE